MADRHSLRLVVEALQQVAIRHHADLRRPTSLLPLNVEINCASDFSRGALACVVHVLHSLSQSPEGRQAILDLGLQPLFEKVESPTPSGGQDV